MTGSRVVTSISAAESKSVQLTGKLIDLDELAARCDEFRGRDLTIAHCHGCFDLMHPGHLKHFEAAKRFADVLVVTVTPDRYVQKGGNRPAFPEALRAFSISCLSFVDFVAVNRWPTAVETLKLLRPSYFVKGQEFEALEDTTGKIQEEADTVRQVGAKLRFTREAVFSSTELLGTHFGFDDRRAEHAEVVLEPDAGPSAADTATTHEGPQAAELVRQIERIAELRICVIGDTIIDEYHHCEPLGLASKSSVVAHRRHEEEAHAGGILAIANHVAELCEHVHLVSMLGAEDSREQFVREHLNPKVDARFFHRPDSPSIIKRRYVSRQSQQKLFEINNVPTDFMDQTLESEVSSHLESALPDFDLVLVADFGHGFLSDRLIKVIESYAPHLAVNTQTNSANAGFNLITRYPRADIVCIDEMEARMAAHSRHGDIGTIAHSLAQDLQTDAFVVTLGSKGCLAVDRAEQAFEAQPIQNTAVVDPTGAGDAFLSFCTPALAAGLPLSVAIRLGNAAGALAVQIVGNRRPVRKEELIDFLTAEHDSHRPEDQAHTQVDDLANYSSTLTAASDPVPAIAPEHEEPSDRSGSVLLAGAAPLAGCFKEDSEYPHTYYRDFVDRARRVIASNGDGNPMDLYDAVLQVSETILAMRNAGRKMMIIGNGASAAISSHMAADYAKNGGVRAIAFNDAALLTAVSNDTSYAQVFETPIRRFADPGDILVAISSSGKSPNILHGSRAARELGCHLITLSGFKENNPLRTLGDVNFYVPCESYGVTEVLHHSICHCVLDTFINHHQESEL